MPLEDHKNIPGIPNPRKFGDPRRLPTGEMVPFAIQEHRARRAGKHFDLRLGPKQMFSWATRKELPGPGGKISLFQTPLHSEQYGMNFEGTIPAHQYGAGMVRMHDRGRMLVQHASPDKINIVTAHKKVPMRFTFVRDKKVPRKWLLINTTPKDLQDVLGRDVKKGIAGQRVAEVLGIRKQHYKKTPAEKLMAYMSPDATFSEKIDGAAMLYKILKNRVEAVSYRVSKSGIPIVHTERMDMPTNLQVPKELEGTVLRGEAYGEKQAAALPSVSDIKERLMDLVYRSYEYRQGFKLYSAGRKAGVEMPGALSDVFAEAPRRMAEKDAAVEIDVEKGDTILTGRFKNKKVKVKTLGTDENGQPTINGRKMLTFRLEKLMKESMEKKSIVVKDKPHWVTRPVSAAMGVVTDKGTEKLFGGKFNWDKVTPEHVTQLAEHYGGNLDRVQPLEVQLGSARVMSRILRRMTNKEAPMSTRISSTILSPLTESVAALTRADHYDPTSNTVVLYHPHKAILAHELGHAYDASRSKNRIKWSDRYASTPGNILKGERAASEKALKVLKGTSPKRDVDAARKMLMIAYGTYVDSAVAEEALEATLKAGGSFDEAIAAGEKAEKKSKAKRLKEWAKKGPFLNLVKRSGGALERPAEKRGGAIPAAELGGILNATLQEAQRKKREKNIAMRNAIFDIYVKGRDPVARSVPYKERVEMIKEVLRHLPQKQFHLPRMATTPEEQKKLWEDIKAGRNQRTHEGVVFWDAKGKPHKTKLLTESDVHITDIFPQVKGDTSLAGGFRYALKPGGDPVGKVGTGFSSEVRKQMMESPDDFIGRVARIRAQEQFPSGAYRAPAFLALHEDYPNKPTPVTE